MYQGLHVQIQLGYSSHSFWCWWGSQQAQRILIPSMAMQDGFSAFFLMEDGSIGVVW